MTQDIIFKYKTVFFLRVEIFGLMSQLGMVRTRKHFEVYLKQIKILHGLIKEYAHLLYNFDHSPDFYTSLINKMDVEIRDLTHDMIGLRKDENYKDYKFSFYAYREILDAMFKLFKCKYSAQPLKGDTVLREYRIEGFKDILGIDILKEPENEYEQFDF